MTPWVPLTKNPTANPTKYPTANPTDSPTANPTGSPTKVCFVLIYYQYVCMGSFITFVRLMFVILTTFIEPDWFSDGATDRISDGESDWFSDGATNGVAYC